MQSESVKLWIDFSESRFDVLKNFLNFSLDTIVEHVFINLSSHSSKSYAPEIPRSPIIGKGGTQPFVHCKNSVTFKLKYTHISTNIHTYISIYLSIYLSQFLNNFLWMHLYECAFICEVFLRDTLTYQFWKYLFVSINYFVRQIQLKHKVKNQSRKYICK